MMAGYKRKAAPDVGASKGGKCKNSKSSIPGKDEAVKAYAGRPETETDRRYITALELQPTTREDMARVSLAAMVLMQDAHGIDEVADLRLIKRMLDPCLLRLALMNLSEQETARAISQMRYGMGDCAADRIAEAYDQFCGQGGMSDGV